MISVGCAHSGSDPVAAIRPPAESTGHGARAFRAQECRRSYVWLGSDANPHADDGCRFATKDITVRRGAVFARQQNWTGRRRCGSLASNRVIHDDSV
jgi:hypothetical protein